MLKVAPRCAALELGLMFDDPPLSQLESASPTSRCDISPLRWLRHEGGESFRMLDVAPRCAALELQMRAEQP
jgi:hypothetical protein